MTSIALPNDEKGKTRFGKVGPIWVSLAGLAIGLALVIVTADLSDTLLGVLSIALSLVLIAIGVHIGAAILLGSIVGIYSIGGWSVLRGSLVELPFETAASWQYSVIPMFILMGIALWMSGISSRAFDAARQWFGWLPGGLAIGTTAAGGGLAAASGSTIGIAYALARVSIPEMIKANYRPSLAIGTVTIIGLVGQIIPPSIILVIYAGIAQTPVGPQLLAGVVPGILLLVVFAVLIVTRSIISKTLAPTVSQDDITWGSRFASLRGVLPIVLVITVIVGGLGSGVFTATEAGAVGAAVAIVLGILMLPKEGAFLPRSAKFLSRSFVSTVGSTASILLLLIGVYFLTRLMTISRAASDLAAWLSEFGLSPVQFLLVLVPFYLILGMFLDTLAVLLITVPVLLPTLISLDIDLIWFGVFVVILAELALATPPLGLLVFVVHRIAQNPDVGLGTKVSLAQAFAGTGWFVAAAVVVALLLLIFPDLVTWLPSVAA